MPKYLIKSTMRPGFNNAGQFGLKPTAVIPKDIIEKEIKKEQIIIKKQERIEKRLEEESRGIFKCSRCLKTFKSKALLLGHIRFAHPIKSEREKMEKNQEEIKNNEIEVKKEIKNNEVGEIKDKNIGL